MVVESGENLIGYLRNKNSGFKLEKKEKKSNQSLEFILKQKQLN